MNEQKIPKRILNALMNSIAAGIVPRIGAPYIAIGRTEEINALVSDLEMIADGGSTMRFIIGKYGSGKSFLLQLIRGSAIDRGFVTADADLSPERRLCGTNGAGIATYRELIRNLACKSSPDGSALSVIISGWLSDVQAAVAASGVAPGSPKFDEAVNGRIFETVSRLREQIGGFDFATVLTTYRTAAAEGDDETQGNCLRWLRGEFETKTDAKRCLRVGGIINDDNWYEYIKLLAVFARLAGYSGMLVLLDECVNLYKITNRVSRENNYEKLLSMFNDTLQGRAPGLGIFMGGTPQFLEDTRRGLFSYEALRSRLADSRYSGEGYRDMIGPVIRLRRLSDDELFALVVRLTKLHGQRYDWEPPVTADEMADFLRLELSRAGAEQLITPREIIRDYLSVLNIVHQNRDATFAEVCGIVTKESQPAPAEEASEAETYASDGVSDIDDIEI